MTDPLARARGWRFKSRLKIFFQNKKAITQYYTRHVKSAVMKDRHTVNPQGIKIRLGPVRKSVGPSLN